MSKSHMISVGCLVVMSLVHCATGQESKKSFKTLKCTLSLPDETFQWIDLQETIKPIAMFGNEAGLKMWLMAEKVGDTATMDEPFIKKFEEKLMGPANGTKISGSTIEFRGLSCYEFRMKMPQSEVIVTSRAFFANKHMYILHVTSRPGDEDRARVLFKSFEFIGEPVKHISSDIAILDHFLSAIAGFIGIAFVFYCLKGLFKKKKKDTLLGVDDMND